MKPAKEISDNLHYPAGISVESARSAFEHNEKMIKQALLDAYKAGMSEAAEIAQTKTQFASSAMTPLVSAIQAILDARDKKTFMSQYNKYTEYLKNVGGSISIEKFDEDWEPFGSMIRFNLREQDLIREEEGVMFLKGYVTL